MGNIDEPTGSPQPIRRAASRELRLGLVSLALAAPAWIPYLLHFAAPPPGRLPTGFIFYDLPYYIANAREHFEGGRFQLFFSNPYDPRYEAPALYVQPMSLALGGILHATGVDPGLLLVGFEVVAAWVGARVALALYAEVVGLGDRARRLGLVAFFWGGGLLTMAGIASSLAKHGQIRDIFRFDPAGGWWFLNFGRNLVFPTEALYHALFFGCILAVLRRGFLGAAILASLVSASHPFTGAELLLIPASWSALELSFVRSAEVPRWFFLAVVGLLGLHLGYYLGYLGRFPEHRKLMAAWSLPWELEAVSFVPAYAPVGGLAYWSFRRLDLARAFFARPRNRLFLTWSLVAFALANHEFAVRPIQPLHFTRGYIWTPLFLMGAIPLVDLLASLGRRTRPALGAAAIGATLALLLMDNALWLAQFPLEAWRGGPAPAGFTVTAPQLDLYRWLSRAENRGALLLAADRDLAYLSSAYTPLRSWTGHQHNTPDAEEHQREVDAFLEQGRKVDAWLGRTLLIVVDRTAVDPRRPPDDRARLAFENAGYRVYRLGPA